MNNYRILHTRAEPLKFEHFVYEQLYGSYDCTPNALQTVHPLLDFLMNNWTFQRSHRIFQRTFFDTRREIYFHVRRDKDTCATIYFSAVSEVYGGHVDTSETNILLDSTVICNFFFFFFIKLKSAGFEFCILLILIIRYKRRGLHAIYFSEPNFVRLRVFEKKSREEKPNNSRSYIKFYFTKFVNVVWNARLFAQVCNRIV